MESGSNKLALEQGWNDAVMAHNRRWAANRSTHRMYVREGSELVLWLARNNRPEAILETYRVGNIGLNAEAGLTIWLRSTARQSSDALVGHTPREVGGMGLFLWTPAFADVRFAPVDYADLTSPRRLSVPLCVKTATNPTQVLRDEEAYLTERRDFEKTWSHL